MGDDFHHSTRNLRRNIMCAIPARKHATEKVWVPWWLSFFFECCFFERCARTLFFCEICVLKRNLTTTLSEKTEVPWFLNFDVDIHTCVKIFDMQLVAFFLFNIVFSHYYLIDLSIKINIALRIGESHPWSHFSWHGLATIDCFMLWFGINRNPNLRGMTS